MNNKILFKDNNPDRQNRTEINFSDLYIGADILFKTKYKDEIIRGSVTEIFIDDKSKEIIGCQAISDTGVWHTLYEENEISLFLLNSDKNQESIQATDLNSGKNIPKVPPILDKSHSIEEVNNFTPKINKVLPNLFAGREFVTQENSKFPEWSIIPPNQFINPRIKQK